MTKSFNKKLLQEIADGNSANVAQALSDGANPNFQCKNGCTALILAADLCNKEIISNLIRAGANLDLQNNNGYTALMWSSYWGIEGSVCILLKLGANINIRNNQNLTARDIAVKYGHKNCVDLIDQFAQNDIIDFKF